MKNPQLFYNYEKDCFAIRCYEEYKEADNKFEPMSKWRCWVLLDPIEMGAQEWIDQWNLAKKIQT